SVYFFLNMKKPYQSLEDNLTNNMKQVIHRKLDRNILRLSLIILLAFSTSLHAQEGDPVAGKALFNTNCAACHQLDKKMTGPALRNVEARLADEEGLDREWLSKWIRNSAGVIKSGDAYAVKIFDEYGGAAMTAYPQLSDEDISNILAYTAEEKKEAPAAVAGGAVAANPQSDGASNTLILAGLAILFAILAGALVLVNKTLRRFADEKGIELNQGQK